MKTGIWMTIGNPKINKIHRLATMLYADRGVALCGTFGSVTGPGAQAIKCKRCVILERKRPK